MWLTKYTGNQGDLKDGECFPGDCTGRDIDKQNGGIDWMIG